MYPSKIKRLRRTEWHYKINGFGEAMSLRIFLALGYHAAKTNPSMKVKLHLFAKKSWNLMMKTPNIDYTPSWDVIPKHWKGLDPLEKELDAAERALADDPDDVGFSKRELGAEVTVGSDGVVERKK